jgi:hypothetical protein
MTGADAVPDGDDEARKRATLRTRHDDPTVVAAAVRPDNTDAMRTTVESEAGGRVVTRVERPTAGGLRSTVDDYVVNLRVAERVAAAARGETATGVDNRDADATAAGPSATDATDATAADPAADDVDDAATDAERTAQDGPNDSDIITDDTHDT